MSKTYNCSDDGYLAQSQLSSDTVDCPQLDRDCQGRNDEERNGNDHKYGSCMIGCQILVRGHKRLIDARSIISADLRGHCIRMRCCTTMLKIKGNPTSGDGHEGNGASC